MALLAVAAIDIGNFKRYDTVDVLPDTACLSEFPGYCLPDYIVFALAGEIVDYAYLKDPLIIPENPGDAFASEREHFYNFDEHISDARLEEIRNSSDWMIVDILERDIERKVRLTND